MSVKILGGCYKGSKIAVPPKGTRPTAVLLRRRYFDSVQDLSGRLFVDLCAGSGAMGFEAVSRGACAVHFIDEGRQQVSYLKKNIDSLGISNGSAFVHRSDAIKWLKQNINIFSKDAIIFFDPPYDDKSLYLAFVNLIPESRKCEVVIELSSKTSFYNEVLSLVSCHQSKLVTQGEKIFLRLI